MELTIFTLTHLSIHQGTNIIKMFMSRGAAVAQRYSESK
jgi:hypothetical protein